jgi:hypothetical protein
MPVEEDIIAAVVAELAKEIRDFFRAGCTIALQGSTAEVNEEVLKAEGCGVGRLHDLPVGNADA